MHAHIYVYIPFIYICIYAYKLCIIKSRRVHRRPAVRHIITSLTNKQTRYLLAADPIQRKSLFFFFFFFFLSALFLLLLLLPFLSLSFFFTFVSRASSASPSPSVAETNGGEKSPSNPRRADHSVRVYVYLFSPLFLTLTLLFFPHSLSLVVVSAQSYYLAARRNGKGEEERRQPHM